MIALRQILLKLDLNHALAKAFSIEEMEFPANTLLITKHAFKINELWKMVRDKSFSEIIFYKGMEFEDELTDIDIPLQIRVFDLSDESNFYEGKSIIIVKPKEA
ncbi:MAG: hypothetical protein U5K69_12345 [Balneolaceae bacterium]|nr:hypothetical protein [Balneolaceae bacterium]